MVYSSQYLPRHKALMNCLRCTVKPIICLNTMCVLGYRPKCQDAHQKADRSFNSRFISQKSSSTASLNRTYIYQYCLTFFPLANYVCRAVFQKTSIIPLSFLISFDILTTFSMTVILPVQLIQTILRSPRIILRHWRY